MKFNWGTGIALVYATFAIGMIGLAMASSKHDPGLMQKDYYALDLNYQDRLERKQNTASLVVQPFVLVAHPEKSLSIHLPEGMESALGIARFYRSTTVDDDFSVKIENGQPLQVSSEKMAPGRWHVELEWEAAGKRYFWETAVVI